MGNRSIDDLAQGYSGTLESITNIFYRDSLEPIIHKVSNIAKHAYYFVRGAIRKENLPAVIAEGSGYLGSYSLAIGLAAFLKYVHCPDSIISVISVPVKDGLFWLANTVGYKIGHEMLLPHKLYPEHYLKTLIKGNVLATLIKIPFQVTLFYLLMSNNSMPLWKSFMIGQTAGLIPAIVRWTINYRGKIWTSQYKEPPTNTPQA